MTPDDAREQLLRALLVERFTPTPTRRPEPAREPQPERGGHLRLEGRFSRATDPFDAHVTERQSA